MSYRDRLGNHQDHARIATALEESANVYSDFSDLEKEIARSFDEARTGKVWKTRFYRYGTNQTTEGTKLLDNADMAIPTPATDTAEGSDDYLQYGVFQWQHCNYVRDDSDGFARPTAIEGMVGFKDSGAVDIGTLRMTFYWKQEIHTTYIDWIMSDTPHKELGLVPWTDAVKVNADGSIKVMPYFIVSSYNSVKGSDGYPRSQHGTPLYNQSYNSQITDYQKKGAGYWGSGASRNSLQIIWERIKYATKSSQKYFMGTVSYDAHIKVAFGESNTKRVLVATSATIFSPQTCISISKTGDASNVDRQSTDCHATVDRAMITSIETVTINSVSYLALNLDVDTAFTTDTGMYVVTMPAHSGVTDSVIGLYDGSPVSNTDGKHSYRVGGVEYMNGQAVIPSDTVMEFNSDYTKNVYCAERGTAHVANAHTNYKLVGKIPKAGDIWQGSTKIDMSTGCHSCLEAGGGDSVGNGDFIWGGGNSSGLREYYQCGALGSGSGAGASSVLAGVALSGADWAYASCD